ncbi:hypothetical protein RINTHH_16670 [Richelia intracellularis HH01]|uniref:Uncharacterized protein n=1 Tax=Richelia intracellularis HH01 TaxID=1165094 RepID=M1WZR5_9NOST|nr:hypothetical protein RINTHH_16670 [Richelia intracellularis HH01]
MEIADIITELRLVNNWNTSNGGYAGVIVWILWQRKWW